MSQLDIPTIYIRTSFKQNQWKHLHISQYLHFHTYLRLILQKQPPNSLPSTQPFCFTSYHPTTQMLPVITLIYPSTHHALLPRCQYYQQSYVSAFPLNSEISLYLNHFLWSHYRDSATTLPKCMSVSTTVVLLTVTQLLTNSIFFFLRPSFNNFLRVLSSPAHSHSQMIHIQPVECPRCTSSTIFNLGFSNQLGSR